MAATELALTNQTELVEKALVGGDLSKLSPAERTNYYMSICSSIGFNPLTRPFDYITLNGKLTLYARKDCTDQLRNIKKVSLEITDRSRIEDVYIVTARATLPDGRTDESTGAVCIAGLKGEQLANAYMKAETKAKRRVTLSICGLGFTDESEVESIPGARKVNVDMNTGEVIDADIQNNKEPVALADEDKIAEIKHIWSMVFLDDTKAGNAFCYGILGHQFKPKTLTQAEANELIAALEAKMPDPEYDVFSEE